MALLKCDDSLKTAFKPDAQTSVLLVQAFKANDPLLLSGTATANTPKAPADLCLVKLLVGPGSPGTPGVPSTSAGIGIQILLPTAGNWNERIRSFGNGGWSGSAETSLTAIATGDGLNILAAAVGKGFAVSTSDNGHVGGNGSFAMNPDGSINTVLWHDFAERSLHETAEKTKALVLGFYGKAQRFAYFDGYSTGGRQGMKLAQVYPKDYDGIASGAPAINWTRFITGELYPQIVMRRDLGANMDPAKMDALSTAAIIACGGATLGFLVDPLSCRYDPTKDAAALCSGVVGNGGVVGTSAAATCSTLAEATTVNKIWYGQTADGSVPDPATDNGGSFVLAGSNQLWFGLSRGTALGALAGNGFVFPIATDQVALELQDPTYAQPNFLNGKGNGANKWTTLTYAGLTNAAFQGVLLQSSFSNINTDNPDLSAFNARKGKLLLYHGLADNLIAPQGSINYYNRVAATMGGIPAIQSFFRFYLIPGMSHNGSLVGPPGIPMPQNAAGRDEMFTMLQNWVENGTAPGTVEVSSSNGSTSLPLCVYPQQIVYDGTGAQTAAKSYACK